MIYTVTFNPAIDLVVESSLNIGELNRAKTEEYFVGGKGINVSQIAHELGADTLAVGFIGGFTGSFVRSELDNLGIMHHFVPADGTTRVNMKVIGQDRETTEINLTGVHVSAEQFAQLRDYLIKVLTAKDVLVISGNAAEGIGLAEFEELAKMAQGKGCPLVLDTNEAYLEKLLKYQPFLIKPNAQELTAIFAGRHSYEDDIVSRGRLLQREGAKNVIISNGSKGAIMVAEDGVYYGDPLEGSVVSAVGSGDSLVAGFITEYLRSHDYGQAFRLGLAAASATAFCSGLASGPAILALVDEAAVVKQAEER